MENQQDVFAELPHSIPIDLSRPVFDAAIHSGVFAVSEPARLIGTCRVINSSGCHRYGYWNEQYLFDGRADTGWCTPSRKSVQQEFLEIDTGTTKAISRLRMRSRAINPEAGFPKTIIIRTQIASGEWIERCKLRTGMLAADCWHEWALPQINGPLVRIDFDDIAVRPEGKYFLQFMALELYAGV